MPCDFPAQPLLNYRRRIACEADAEKDLDRVQNIAKAVTA
jgi:hypothetical protein